MYLTDPWQNQWCLDLPGAGRVTDRLGVSKTKTMGSNLLL
jgi:hypothetical protein